MGRRPPRSPGYLPHAPSSADVRAPGYGGNMHNIHGYHTNVPESTSDIATDHRVCAPNYTKMGQRMPIGEQSEVVDDNEENVKPVRRQPSQHKTFTPPPPPPPLLAMPTSSTTYRPGMPVNTKESSVDSRCSKSSTNYQKNHSEYTSIYAEGTRSPPRRRNSGDIRQWLSWRMKINDQLSSFVMRLSEDGDYQLPVRELPGNMTDDTLACILSHADQNDNPSTSLDRFSYMIYGVPRVKCTPNRPLKRTKSSRGKKDSYKALRRKVSTKRNLNTSIHMNNNFHDDSFCGGDPVRHQQTSSIERTLDFSEEYGWTDDGATTEDECRYTPHHTRSALHEELLARGRNKRTDRSNGSPYRHMYGQDRVSAQTPIQPTTPDHQTSRQYSSSPYVHGPPNKPIRGRQPSFKPPGGVPTILSLQNLPNQAQVPLRHVTSRHGARQ